MEKVETMHFVADAFNTDFKGELSYDILGRNLLNSAEDYANKREFGFKDIIKDNHSWVISRISIEMKQMPKMGKDYYIDTWIESIYRMFTNRDYCVRDEDGNVCGYSRIIWAMIDNTTRQPIDLKAEYGEKFQPLLAPELPCEVEGHCRLRPLGDVEPKESIVAKYNDLDCNGHFNSIKYLTHVLDLFSMDFHRSHKISRAEIAYSAEAYYDDELTFFLEEMEPMSFHFEIRKHYNVDRKGEIIAKGLVNFI